MIATNKLEEDNYARNETCYFSIGLLGAAIYFTGLFSGYIVPVLLVGYVLMFEENGWLRRSTAKALSLRMLPWRGDFIQLRTCKLNCEKLSTLPFGKHFGDSRLTVHANPVSRLE